MGNRTLSSGHTVEDSSVEETDIEAFVVLPSDQRFQVLKTLRHEASLLAGGGLAPMAGIYLSTLAVSLPLIALVSPRVDQTWAVPVSIVLGSVLLIFGLYFTAQVILGQRQNARSATRLAFHEEALRQHSEDSGSGHLPSRRWFSRSRT